MKTIQYFSEDYIKKTRHATPEQILNFLEQFRLMQSPSKNINSCSKMISLKITEDLLKTFRAKCEIEGIKYQTQIKNLMSQWVD